MPMGPGWLRAVLAHPWLIPVPLDEACRPDLLRNPVPDVYSRDAWLLIAPGLARLHPQLAGILKRESHRRPDVSIFYADEAENAAGGHAQALLKPDLDLTLLISHDYIGSPVMVRLAAFRDLGGFREEMGTATVHDLLLRAVSAGVVVSRITEVLVAHAGGRARPLLEDRMRAVRAWAADCRPGIEVLQGRTEGSLRLHLPIVEFPSVTLVIPTRQAPAPDGINAAHPAAYVVGLLDDIARTDWPMDRLQVIVGDDVADDAIYGSRSDPFALRRIPTPRPDGEEFNYAAKMNRLWRQATSEYLVLLNDDVILTDAGWLRALMTFATDEAVGGVGARLLYPDGRLQHAGMAGGLCGLCAHAWIFTPAGDRTYGDWALVQREWSIVTGAVFATRRSVLEAVNGFDERFSLEFNDVDLCLRLKSLGYRIVYTPYAEMIHREKASRGFTRPAPEQIALFLRRWGGYLDNDPAFHPRFDMADVRVTPLPLGATWLDQGER